MRVVIALVAGLLILTWAVGPSSAGPNPGKAVSAPPQTVSDLRVAPSTGVRQSIPLSGALAMTASDCTDLGGEVRSDTIGVCASTKVCVRTDNRGATHAVCLSATSQ
jgi:hypothetical protein